MLWRREGRPPQLVSGPFRIHASRRRVCLSKGEDGGSPITAPAPPPISYQPRIPLICPPPPLDRKKSRDHSGSLTSGAPARVPRRSSRTKRSMRSSGAPGPLTIPEPRSRDITTPNPRSHDLAIPNLRSRDSQSAISRPRDLEYPKTGCRRAVT